MRQLFKLLLLVITDQIFSFNAAYAASNWQLGFQKAVTPVMEQIESLHNILMIVITITVLIVFILIAYVILRFNAKANPIPNKFSHNLTIEIIWTIIPVIILCIIAVPSIRTLYYINTTPEPEMTVKVVGYQWYWHYQYPDHGNFEFDSYMIQDAKLTSTDLRLFEVDNRVVIPANTNVKFLITAGDVIHSFAVPAFGIKTDSVPGRVNETWVRVTEPGIYRGQCSELCGINHGFMPIVVEVVTKQEFDEWIAKAKEKYK